MVSNLPTGMGSFTHLAANRMDASSEAIMSFERFVARRPL